jgi:elongation factor Ts
MTTTIETIKNLREVTGAGILECRQALEANNFQYAGALADLQEQAVLKASKKNDRPAMQGTVEVYSHGGGRIGVMLEVNCETDFTTRSTRFRDFVHELALQIAAASPRWVVDADVPSALLEQESARAAERARMEGKHESLIPHICEGTIKKFLDRTVLLRQVSIRDDSTTVAHLLSLSAAAVGENVIIRRFVRWELTGDLDKEL